MNDSQRRRQYQLDREELERAVGEYQHPNGHAEITVKIQHGLVTVIEDVRKRKPRKAEGAE